MNYALACKYGKVFEVISSPYALMILDYLIEKDDYISINELKKISQTTESKVRDILDELIDLYVIDKEYVEDQECYKVVESSVSNFLDYVIERID